jgi:mono/diheme cytochrome c family protein
MNMDSPKPHLMTKLLCAIVVAAYAILFCAAVDTSWKDRVPAADRNRVNPYAQQPDAIAGGAKLFADHCAKCHGSDALGRGKRPSLRGPEVQQAYDGELFWILKNGYLRRGMPTWSALPEESRWQIIAYIKSLGQVDQDNKNPTNSAKGTGQ